MSSAAAKLDRQAQAVIAEFESALRRGAFVFCERMYAANPDLRDRLNEVTMPRELAEEYIDDEALFLGGVKLGGAS